MALAGRLIPKLAEKYIVPVIERHVYRPLVRKLEEKLPSVVRFFDPIRDPKYLEKRYRYLGKVASLRDIVSDFQSKLTKLPEEKRMEAYDYLTSSEEIFAPYRWLKDLKEIIAQQGRELVERGILKPEQYEKWKYEYLPRWYSKFFKETEPPVKLEVYKSGVKLSPMRYAKHRKRDIPYPGLIRDPAVLAPKSVLDEGMDIIIHDFLREISANPEWVYSPSVVTYRGKTYSTKYLLDLAEKGEITDEKLLKFLRKASRELEEIPSGYIKIPDVKRYGSLRGLVVKDFIARDIMPAFKVTDTVHASKILDVASDVNRRVVDVWKATKVPLNPPTAFRNFISNIIQLNLSGMRLDEIAEFAMKAANEYLTKGRYYQEAFKRGLTQTSFTAAEIHELNTSLRELAGEKSMWGFFRKLYEVMNKATIPYQKIDEFWRLVRFIYGHQVEGRTLDSAMVQAHKWVMDYTLVDPLVKRAREIGLTPFITFQLKILPLVGEALIKRPWVLAKYVSIPYVVTKAAITMNKDFRDEDAARAYSLLPEYYTRGMVFVVPHKSKDGTLRIVPYGYFLPWGYWQEAAYDALTREPYSPLFKMISHPLITAYTGFSTNIDPFLKREISDVWRTDRERLVQMLCWFAKQWAPPFTSPPYGAIHDVIRTMKDLKGHPVAKMLGLNIRDKDIEDLQLSVAKTMRFREYKAGMKIREIKRQIAERTMTPEEGAEQIKKIKEEINELKRELLTKKPRSLLEEIYLP
ncbi:MAG: hypothetical protein QW561_02535 [Candidatus Aenigmatarchaeota archaeon]